MKLLIYGNTDGEPTPNIDITSAISLGNIIMKFHITGPHDIYITYDGQASPRQDDAGLAPDGESFGYDRDVLRDIALPSSCWLDMRRARAEQVSCLTAMVESESLLKIGTH